MKSTRAVAAFLSALLVLVAATPALAYQYSISNFKVLRNGIVFFEDTFSDGSPPPSAPSDSSGSTNSYGGRGSFGPEAGGKLTIDSGGLSASDDPNRLVQKAVLKSDTSSDPAKGLKSGQTFSVTGVFDLILPHTDAEWYFIELHDSTATINGTESVKLGVRRKSAASVIVAFMRKNTVTFQATIIDQSDLEPNHSQIQLVLSKTSASSNVISASFAYVDGGVVGPATTFANTSAIFTANPFARAVFGASAPVATAVATGPSSALTLTCNLKVTREARGLQGGVYLAGMTQGILYFHNGTNWVQYNGGAFPVYKSGVLTDQSVPILSGQDVSALTDLTLYLGYGTSDADLVANGTFSQVYCATSSVCLPEKD